MTRVANSGFLAGVITHFSSQQSSASSASSRTQTPDDTHAAVAPQRNAVSLPAQSLAVLQTFVVILTALCPQRDNKFHHRRHITLIQPNLFRVPSGFRARQRYVATPADSLRATSLPRRKRVRPHSIDVSALGPPSQPASLAPARPGTSSSTQTQRSPGVKGNMLPNLPPRKPRALSALAISPDRHHRELVSSFAGNMTEPSPASSDGPSSAISPTGSGGGGRRGISSSLAIDVLPFTRC